MSEKMKKRCQILIGVTFVLTVISMIVDRVIIVYRKGMIIQLVVEREWIPFILTVFALVCAFIYISKDAGKQSAIFQKLFAGSFLVMYIYYFHMLVFLLPYGSMKQQAVIHLFIMVLLVSYSAVLILTFAPNLGKRYSLILASIAAVAELIIMMIAVVEGVTPGVIGGFITNILMITIFYLMVEAKYMDKDARGAF